MEVLKNSQDGLELGLNSIHLQKLAAYCQKNFVQVIPCDKIISYEMLPKMQFIINLSDSRSQGSHWIAPTIHENYVIYFDSFGEKCKNKWILTKFKNSCLIQSNKQIQDYSSIMCGYFSLSFLIEDSNGKTLEEYLNFFGSDLLDNYKKCVSIITNHIKNSSD